MGKPIKPFKNPAEANEALLKIGTLKRELLKLENKAEEQILKIKSKWMEQGAGMDEEVKALEAAVLEFAEREKESLFAETKTYKLAYGDLKLRVSELLEVCDETLGLCKQYGFGNAVKVKEEVNKQVLKTFTPDDLARVKAERVTKENFSYDLNEAAILARRHA